MEQTALTYLCPDCMAYLRYDGKEQKWVCDYCGGKFTREELEQRGAETKQDDYEVKPRAEAAENTAEIFFRTSAECKSVKDQEFLKKLKLVISMDGKKLYSGDLLAVSLNKAVSLGIFQPGKSGEMKFQITVPSELNNDFALRNGDVKWIFSVEEDQKEKIQPSQTPAGQYEKEENSDGYSRKTGASSGKTAPVKTGDDTGIRFFLILEEVALLAGILVLRKGGRKN